MRGRRRARERLRAGFRGRIEVAVGLLVTMIGVGCLGLAGRWVARQLGPGSGYELTADFASAGGLRPLAAVEIAGVRVGSVKSISLRDDTAHVVLRLDAPVRVPADSTAVIQTEGLIGETHVKIQPGRHGAQLTPGGRIGRTVSAITLEDAIAAKIFGQVS